MEIWSALTDLESTDGDRDDPGAGVVPGEVTGTRMTPGLEQS